MEKQDKVCIRTKEGLMGIFTEKVAGDISILNKKLTSLLKNNISPEEKVLFCLQGSMDPQALIALASRILIIESHYLGQHKTASFFYRDITSIETEKGIFFSNLKIYTAIEDDQKRGAIATFLAFLPDALLHNCFAFENRFLPTFLPYFEKIRALIQENTKSGESCNQKKDDSKAAKPNIAEQIEKLSNLRQSGALTEEEYLQAKKKILEA